MTTILRASPRSFVSTPSIERIATRALRYLQSGFSVHLRGPAGTGKTTLALHLADLLARPIMLIFGDDEFKSSDLIGNQSGYTRKKVVDNFIHSVVKVEDELRQNWVDSRLTLACREGFTLVYDEFNRSRPEVNNVLLSALEEKLLVLPPSSNRSEYIRVNPHFRAIFTSNPEEYCGVHSTQDALLDRLVTINMPEPDELTQQEILVQKTGIDRVSAALIVQLVKTFRDRTGAEKTSGLRSCLMTAKICHEHDVMVALENPDFRDICNDMLLARSNLPLHEAKAALWELLNEFSYPEFEEADRFEAAAPTAADSIATATTPTGFPFPLPPNADDDVTVVLAAPKFGIMPPTDPITPAPDLAAIEAMPPLPPEEDRDITALLATPELGEEPAPAPTEHPVPEFLEVATATEPVATETASEPLAELPYEEEIYTYLWQAGGARLSQVEQALGLDRFQTVDAIRSLTEKGRIVQRDRLFVVAEAES